MGDWKVSSRVESSRAEPNWVEQRTRDGNEREMQKRHSDGLVWLGSGLWLEQPQGPVWQNGCLGLLCVGGSKQDATYETRGGRSGSRVAGQPFFLLRFDESVQVLEGDRLRQEPAQMSGLQVDKRRVGWWRATRGVI